MQQLSEKPTKQKSGNDLRILPLGVAGLICFVIGVSSGSLTWYFLGSNSPRRNQPPIVATAHLKPESSPTSTGGNTPVALGGSQVAAVAEPAPSPQTVDNNQPTPSAPAIEPSPETNSSPPQPVTNDSSLIAPTGEVPVEGGEVVLGGGETKLPLRRESVESFAVAETEVTNQQFREFVEDTKAKINVPVGNDDEPVTNISWYEARKYCEWLSKKIGAEVRLPTEAEWELAAGGKQNWKYPWGNQWQDDKAACKENNGKVRPVKSYPNGKSPFGAYDMIGNVWEWTVDAGRDQLGRITKYKGGDTAFTNETLYVVKGGAAIEAKANNNVQTKINMPSNFRSPDIGFRYVILRNKPVQNENKN